MCETRFFRCQHCGNLVGLICNAGAPMICCGETMEELIPGSVDASREKHVPVITTVGNLVTVKLGLAEHPMTEEHAIQWVYLLTDRGGQRKCLKPGEKPEAVFALHQDQAKAAYAYCNLHGLRKTD
ncbi:MAG: desulfoferrodoxin family protein, partial [Clostridiales bacterium]